MKWVFLGTLFFNQCCTLERSGPRQRKEMQPGEFAVIVEQPNFDGQVRPSSPSKPLTAKPLCADQETARVWCGAGCLACAYMGVVGTLACLG